MPDSRRAAEQGVPRQHPYRRKGDPGLTGRKAPAGAVVSSSGRIVPVLLVAVDVVAIALAVLITATGGLLEYAMLPVLLLANRTGGLYRPRLTLTALDEVPALLVRGLAAAGLTAAGIAAAAPAGAAGGSFALLPFGFVAAAVLYTALAVTGRAAAYAVLRAERAKGRFAERVVVLGAGRIGGQVVAMLQRHPEYGMHPIGYLDSAPPPFGEPDGLSVLGGPRDLADVITRHDVQRVIIAFGAFNEWEMVDTIRRCEQLGCHITFVPRFFELATGRSNAGDQLSSYPVGLLGRPRNPVGRVGKRLLDVSASATALVLLSPVLAVCALAVRLETGPGVLFRQERIGRAGRPFTVLKFRSLKPVDETESATKWNVAHDGRLGPVGRFLRKTSLDELPQLWNILRGDMSLVGPRPERPHFVEEFGRAFPNYDARHRVSAGLTGWSQVNGLRGDTSIEDRARFDNYYIENWSLWRDIGIMARTISSVLRSKGA